MSSARRTPAYVQIIGPDPLRPLPIGPKLVGPERLIGPVEPRHSGRTEVIPLRPNMPASLPPIPLTDTLSKPRPIVPLSQRPWRVMIVPASPSQSIRSFNLARWQAWLMIAAIAGVVLLVTGVSTVVVLAVREPDMFMPNSEAAALRARLATVEDSLIRAQGTFAAMEATAAAADSAVAADLLAAAVAPSPSKSVTARLHAKGFRTPVLRAPSSAAPARAKATAAGTDSRLFEGLPVIGAIASGFSRARRHPLLHIMRPHLGLDVAAPRGTAVSAPADGRVSFVGRKFGFGLTLEITHPHAVKTRYGHLKSTNVKLGEHVTRGTLIAAVGSSGISTGPHLHYEIIVQGKRVDPLHYHFAVDEKSAASAVVDASPLPVLAPAPVAGPASATGAHEDSAAAAITPARR